MVGLIGRQLLNKLNPSTFDALAGICPPYRSHVRFRSSSTTTNSFIGNFMNLPPDRTNSLSTTPAPKVVRPLPFRRDTRIITEEYYPPTFPSLSTPLVQLFSVAVHTDFGDGMETPCDIYGSIRAIEEGCAVVKLYDRGPTNPETIFNDGNLSLFGTENSLILCRPTTNTTLDVFLKDRSRDIEVVKGQYVLHLMDHELEDSCDKLMKAQIQGQHGFISMYYTIFRFGFVASITIKISKMHDASAPFADLYGNIVAGYSHATKYCSNDDETKFMKTQLFHKSADHSVQTTLGTPITLSRYVVAVPAYSSLKIEAQLCDSRGQFASGCLEFPVNQCGDCTQLIDGEGGQISVDVSWEDAYSRLFKNVGVVTGSEEGADPEEKREEISSPTRQDSHLRPQISYGQNLGPAFTPSRSMHHIPRKYLNFGTDMVEVFSVFVDGIGCAVSALSGSISVFTFSDDCIYERDLSNVELLSEHKSLASLEGHFCFDLCDFTIALNIKDPVQDLVISRGCIAWNEVRLSEQSLFNKPLCSVIQGPHGYAAVHYMVFGYACRASVEISIFSETAAIVPTNNYGCSNIYGCVFARYGNYDYSTFDKRYYQSRLFDMPRAEPVQLTTHSRIIPLMRSVVAVPVNSSLIVEVDLRAIENGNDKDATLSGTLEFEIDVKNIVRKEFRGKNYRIEGAVKFDKM